MPRTPKIHYRPADRPARDPRIAACNLPSWLPDEEVTSTLLQVTCQKCRQTTAYKQDVRAAAAMIRHELPGQAVLNPELIIRGTM